MFHSLLNVFFVLFLYDALKLHHVYFVCNVFALEVSTIILLLACRWLNKCMHLWYLVTFSSKICGLL